MGLILVILLVLAAAFFSAAETCLTTVSRARMFHIAENGNRWAKMVLRLKEKKEDLISTILLGSTIVNVAGASIATTLAIEWFGDHAVAYVTVIMTILTLLVAEIIPKTFAILHAERCSMLIALPIHLLTIVFKPINSATRWVTVNVLNFLGVGKDLAAPLVSASEVIRGTIELQHQEGGVVKHERDMLGSILDLNDIEVAQVMIHRNQVDMVNADLSVEEIIEAVTHSAHTRIPFWRGNPDNIAGVLHVKDLYRLLQKHNGNTTREEILGLLSKSWFIPSTTSLKEQLFAFRQRKYHIALVVDEYGVYMGIITLEDIIEEIVGDIYDEHDRKPNATIRQQPDGTYILAGTVSIRDLNRQLDWDLPDEEGFSTLAGLVIHEARTIPEQGAMFSFHGYEFIVIERVDNQVVRLKVRKVPEGTGNEGQ